MTWRSQDENWIFMIKTTGSRCWIEVVTLISLLWAGQEPSPFNRNWSAKSIPRVVFETEINGCSFFFSLEAFTEKANPLIPSSVTKTFHVEPDSIHVASVYWVVILSRTLCGGRRGSLTELVLNLETPTVLSNVCVLVTSMSWLSCSGVLKDSLLQVVLLFIVPLSGAVLAYSRCLRSPCGGNGRVTLTWPWSLLHCEMLWLCWGALIPMFCSLTLFVALMVTQAPHSFESFTGVCLSCFGPL